MDKDLNITDDNRIVQALPTIEYILEQGGRLDYSPPWQSENRRRQASKSLRPVANVYLKIR